VEHLQNDITNISLVLYAKFVPLKANLDLADKNLNHLINVIYNENPQFLNIPLENIQQSYRYKELYNKL
jgi:hypothetical protein